MGRIRPLAIASFFFITVISGIAQQLLTVPERTDYKETSRLADVMAFFSQLQAANPDRVVLDSMGQSLEGRPIPLIILGNPAPVHPDPAGKPVLLLVGNIHAGEVEGKEALQMLARDLLRQPDTPILDACTILMVPVFNPDGNERIDPAHRTYQRVSGGVGTRTNALNMDLNRDFIKLDNPETKALVRLFDRWSPLVYVDCHTTNGSYHMEPLTWTWGCSPFGSGDIHHYIYSSMFPEINAYVYNHHNIAAIPYGNFDDSFEPKRWQTFSSRLVYGVGYFGVKGCFSFLNENYAYADFPTRVKACYSLLDGMLQYTLSHADQMTGIIRSYHRQSHVSFLADAQPAEFPDPITIRGFEMERNDHGRPKPTDRRRDYTVTWVGDYTGTEQTIQGAYLLPASLKPIIERLETHGITLFQTTRPFQCETNIFAISSIAYDESPFQGYFMMNKVEGSFRQETRSIPAGWIVVPLNPSQRYRQLAAALLEPESPDALYRYGFISTLLYPSQWRSATGDYPIIRTDSLNGIPMELYHGPR